MMKILKIPFKVATPGQIEHHYAAFLTRTEDILLIGPYLNSNELRKMAANMLKGKEESNFYFVLPIPIIWIAGKFTESYDKNIVNLIKTNQISYCVIIENVPDSIDELKQFAKNVFKQMPNDYVFETGKRKKTSILLAVFLSFWTWLYTYKKDIWKFWIGLGISVLCLFIMVVVAIGNAISTPTFLWFFILVVWIWAIIDSVVKNTEWYKSY